VTESPQIHHHAINLCAANVSVFDFDQVAAVSDGVRAVCVGIRLLHRALTWQAATSSVLAAFSNPLAIRQYRKISIFCSGWILRPPEANLAAVKSASTAQKP